MGLELKFKRLQIILGRLGSAVVAYSGGVDSSFLLAAAKGRVEKLIAVTAKSQTYTRKELDFARKFCRGLGVKHLVVSTSEFSDNRFVSNPRNRCYFCKKELFSALRRIAAENKIDFVLDGSNADDRKDFRPGNRAKKEFCVGSPLEEAGLNKRDIRALSKRFGLLTWDQPQAACLASRVPYGEKITEEKLRKIEKAESLIRNILKVKGDVRARTHQNLLRIEVDKKQILRIINNRDTVSKLKKLGFKYITVDLEGFRSGSMNI